MNCPLFLPINAMITKNYKIADKIIEISSIYDDIHLLCGEYLADGSPDIKISVSMKDIELEANRHSKGKKALINHFSNSYIETLAVYRKIAEQMIDYNTLLFHGSVVAVDGEAYMFAAKSGTGKSTHTRLWRDYFGGRAVMVNDDKPLLKITKDGVYACGTPWNGKHRLGKNIIVPLKAICFLSRAKENHIEPINKTDAFPLLLQHSFKSSDREKILKSLELIKMLSDNTKMYALGCNMEVDAVITAYNAMKGNLYENQG